MKTCTKCKDQKSLSQFYRERKSPDGLRSDCKQCSEERRRKRLGQLSREERKIKNEQRRAKHAEREREYSRSRRRRYRANELIRLAKVRAEKKGLPFDLDQYSHELTERVDKNICELTGISLQRETPKAYNSPSIDRVNPKDGYVYKNVRVVCYALNCAMGTWGEEILIEIVDALKKRR